jgi:polysaccharide biosynthesis/export protein
MSTSLMSKAKRFMPVVCVSLAVACYGQQADSSGAAGLKPNPEAALKAFEPPANQPYELGRGDEITVETIGRPELTSKHVIGPDGKITLPIIGSIEVAGRTREQAAEEVQDLLSSYYAGVTVSIGVDRYTSNRIVVLGAVDHPGVMTFDETPTLLEAISRAGVRAETSVAGEGAAGVRSSAIPEECMIYRGNDSMLTVELKALLDAGSPLADMRLKRDDIVYVTGKSNYVSVLGQVNHPGNLRLERTSSLSDLLAQAGGPTEKAGRNPAVEIIHRNGTGTSKPTQTIPFKSLLQHSSVDVTLQSGDIIYVPESGFNSAAYTIEKLSPLVNLFTVGALFSQQ